MNGESVEYMGSLRNLIRGPYKYNAIANTFRYFQSIFAEDEIMSFKYMSNAPGYHHD
jgi:hypothetical protein